MEGNGVCYVVLENNEGKTLDVTPDIMDLEVTIGFKQMHSLKRNSTVMMTWWFFRARCLWFGMEITVYRHGFKS
jgi:hypothetical protein